MQYLKRSLEQVERITTIAAVFMLVAIVVIVNAQVVARYFLRVSISWPDELARFASVWLTFLGAAIAAHRNELVRVDTFTSLLPSRIRGPLRKLTQAVSLVALVVLLFASVRLFGPAGDAAEPGTGIALRWVFLALPVGVILMAIFTVAAMLRHDDANLPIEKSLAYDGDVEGAGPSADIGGL